MPTRDPHASCARRPSDGESERARYFFFSPFPPCSNTALTPLHLARTGMCLPATVTTPPHALARGLMIALFYFPGIVHLLHNLCFCSAHLNPLFSQNLNCFRHGQKIWHWQGLLQRDKITVARLALGQGRPSVPYRACVPSPQARKLCATG